MRLSSKRFVGIAIAVLTLCLQRNVAGTEDLQPRMHEMVEYYRNARPAWEKWEADKNALSGHSQEEIVRALITEIEIDTGDPESNHERDMSAFHMFQALHFSPSPVCDELDKPVSPQTKASLMLLLYDCTQPEVTPALLRQISDKRPAIEPRGVVEHHLKQHALRVCDIAYNVIVNNAHNREAVTVDFLVGDKRKDEVIQEGLAKLKLTAP